MYAPLTALPGIDSFLGINKYGTLRHTAVPIAQANQYGQLLLPSKSVTASATLSQPTL